MAEGVYVWGGLAGLLLSYLDTHRLKATEVRQTLARYEAGSRMPIATWWSLLDEIAAAQPLPAVGLRIGQHFQLHHFGVLGYLAASCETLGQALLRFQRFQPLLHNLTPTLASQRSGSMQISWDPSYGRSTQLSNEVVVSSLLRLARMLTAQDMLVFSSVEFPGPAPKDTRIYETMIGCPVRFKAKTVIVHIPLVVLDLPIDSRDPHLQAMLDQQAEALLQALPQPDAFLSQLQRLMVNALQEGEPTLQQVAQRMGVAERSLYRRLQERGLTYQSLLNRLRHQLAQRYLADPGLSLSEIALMLGYSEQSAFTRAFKSWCGQTPLRQRKAMNPS